MQTGRVVLVVHAGAPDQDRRDPGDLGRRADFDHTIGQRAAQALPSLAFVVPNNYDTPTTAGPRWATRGSLPACPA